MSAIFGISSKRNEIESLHLSKHYNAIPTESKQQNSRKCAAVRHEKNASARKLKPSATYKTPDPSDIRSLFSDVDVLGLIDASRHEHHAKDHHQDSENYAADHIGRSALGRVLELIKAKARAQKTKDRQ
jgi:hypothetical protein